MFGKINRLIGRLPQPSPRPLPTPPRLPSPQPIAPMPLPEPPMRRPMPVPQPRPIFTLPPDVIERFRDRLKNPPAYSGGLIQRPLPPQFSGIRKMIGK